MELDIKPCSCKSINNTAFAKYNLILSHESHYKIMERFYEFSIEYIGSFGLNRIAYGNRYVSHMVYLGADSMDQLDKGIVSNCIQGLHGFCV